MNPQRTVRNRAIFIVAGIAVVSLLAVGIRQAQHLIDQIRIDRRLESLHHLIQKQAERTGLPHELIRSVIRFESSGIAAAMSSKNARGLMQIRPDAESDALRVLKIPKGDLFDPAYNLLIGTTYLRALWDRFDARPRIALAAYHMGPSRVAKILEANPDITGQQLLKDFANPTTRHYVQKVIGGMRDYSGPPRFSPCLSLPAAATVGRPGDWL